LLIALLTVLGLLVVLCFLFILVFWWHARNVARKLRDAEAADKSDDQPKPAKLESKGSGQYQGLLAVLLKRY
jgi:Na+-transporting methylmalonyl-CoA/oxaloacetate decarboxylase gamma subunit